jgi:hypothetical protein
VRTALALALLAALGATAHAATPAERAALIFEASVFAEEHCPGWRSNPNVGAIAVAANGFRMSDLSSPRMVELEMRVQRHYESLPVAAACRSIWITFGPEGTIIPGPIVPIR